MTFSEAVGMRGMDVASKPSDLSAVSKHLDTSFRAAPPAVSIRRSRVRRPARARTHDRAPPRMRFRTPATLHRTTHGRPRAPMEVDPRLSDPAPLWPAGHRL